MSATQAGDEPVAPAPGAEPPGLDVETLPALPGLVGLYARGAAASGRIAAGRALPTLPGRPAAPAESGPLTLPRTAYRVAHVETDALRTHLRDYQRLLHEPGSDALPSGYLHVLAFPLATAVMVRGDFPLPLLGMVHLANDASLLRRVVLGDVLEVRAWAQGLRPHRRGVQVDLVAQVWVEDPGGASALAWQGVSTYLAKGFDPGSAGEPAPSAVEADGEAEVPRGAWAPPLPTGRWALPGGTGRAYAAISGDRNPIHLSALSAKAFGFRQAIAHGMYTAARALAEVGPSRGDTYRWTVEFAAPVLLPGTVDVSITPADAGHDYVGWSSTRRTRHFAGQVTPL
ncbi:MaoC/PaaZ C-terminal domain-containing protein [Xylanimonas ulmi]|uniref:Acyl dehydratase n=1 Tax=Xylanimonas ulmi TaxID=228973 RepID=A0A4Q7M6S5_9MICO|nr:MaoC/PaaZ C-terminal domain-containing protein [Xylanibacterium ulmi]RZS62342.1 acyl dehydratase [Xylanibacterium ulmi]